MHALLLQYYSAEVNILVKARDVPSMSNGLISVVEMDAEKDTYCIVAGVSVLLHLFLGRVGERERRGERSWRRGKIRRRRKRE